jgi:hypothetical protein
VFLCGQDVALNERIAVPAGAALAHVPLRDDLGASDAPGPFSLADLNGTAFGALIAAFAGFRSAPAVTASQCTDAVAPIPSLDPSGRLVKIALPEGIVRRHLPGCGAVD